MKGGGARGTPARKGGRQGRGKAGYGYRYNGARVGDKDGKALTRELVALGRQRRLEDISARLMSLETEGYTPPVISCNAALAAFCNAGELDRAISLLEWMERQGNSGSNEMSYRPLVTAAGRAGRLGDAFDLARRWKKVSNIVSTYRVHPVEEGKWDVPLLHEALMDACASCGKVHLCEGLYSHIEPRGHRYSRIKEMDIKRILNTLMKAHTNSTRPIGAFGVVREFRRFGVALDLRSYNALLRACLRAERPDLAMSLLGEMRCRIVKENKRKRFTPDVFTCTIVLGALIAAITREKADQERVFRGGLASSTYLPLRVVNQRLCIRFAREVVYNTEIKADRLALSKAVTLASLLGRGKDAFKWLGHVESLLHKQNIRVKLHTYISVLSCLNKTNETDAAVEVAKRATYALTRESDSSEYEELLEAYTLALQTCIKTKSASGVEDMLMMIRNGIDLAEVSPRGRLRLEWCLVDAFVESEIGRKEEQPDNTETQNIWRDMRPVPFRSNVKLGVPVQHIMTSSTHYAINWDATVDCLLGFVESPITTLFVIDSDCRYTGDISTKDLDKVFPSVKETNSSSFPSSTSTSSTTAIKRHVRTSSVSSGSSHKRSFVRDIMRSSHICIGPTATAFEALDMMVTSGQSICPVVAQSGHLMGIVQMRDLIEADLNSLQQQV